MFQHLQILQETDKTYLLTAKCPFCGHKTKLMVSKFDLDRWEKGSLIQNVFPKFTPTQREALMTGMCDDCFPS